MNIRRVPNILCATGKPVPEGGNVRLYPFDKAFPLVWGDYPNRTEVPVY